MSSNDLSDLFRKPTWQDESSKVPGVRHFFVSVDMAVAVLAATTAAEAETLWPEVETSIDDFRQAYGRAIDYYLLIVVPTVSDSDFSILRHAINDTYICRKIVIALDNENTATAIRRQFPIVGSSPILMEKHRKATEKPTNDELEMLANDGVDVIIEELLRRVEGVAT